ncbi:SixA phosphatase family protein [Seonamhaeicola aphaedonensis]|uniref:Phosphohistidine phosphatase n=1 Tax=Seonamhaeicola aphaedonensis TaxID=1461338 RepID=A0A3D9HIM9_9FLAO|nr:histidine phosphatase family protein [Seonamhaeicola aphaedonensis]RED49308.1 phosphohistidine phosphatase [Seonamhaeicola aphaedonensis]
MRKLTLIRHAKSSWEHDVIDHERPLNSRGYKDAVLVSSYLSQTNDLKFDKILSSDAVRARTTANIFMDNFRIDKERIELKYKLYDFSGNDLVEVIKNCDDEMQNLLIFGHNHAITAFVNTYGNDYINNVPTCGVVTIEFDIHSWNELNKGKTIRKLFPRDLKG